MPYNNTPIAPPTGITGTVSLPLARVKKIIHADDDVQSCSNNASFVIAAATEMFIRDLVRSTYDQLRTDQTGGSSSSKSSRPKNIQYKHIANAVARNESLEFLSDVVPRTMTFEKYQEEKRKKEEKEKAARERDRAKARESQGSAVAGSSAAGGARPGSSSHGGGSSSGGTMFDPMTGEVRRRTGEMVEDPPSRYDDADKMDVDAIAGTAEPLLHASQARLMEPRGVDVDMIDPSSSSASMAVPGVHVNGGGGGAEAVNPYSYPPPAGSSRGLNGGGGGY